MTIPSELGFAADLQIVAQMAASPADLAYGLGRACIPEALGADDNEFVASYLTELDSLLTRGADLRGSPWSTGVSGLPPVGLGLLEDDPAELPSALSVASTNAIDRPPNVRRVRSYSSSDSHRHTEASFSPRNAALKSPKHHTSHSHSVVLTRIDLNTTNQPATTTGPTRFTLTQRSAESSPTSATSDTSTANGVTRKKFDFIRNLDGSMTRVEVTSLDTNATHPTASPISPSSSYVAGSAEISVQATPRSSLSRRGSQFSPISPVLSGRAGTSSQVATPQISMSPISPILGEPSAPIVRMSHRLSDSGSSFSPGSGPRRSSIVLRAHQEGGFVQEVLHPTSPHTTTQTHTQSMPNPPLSPPMVGSPGAAGGRRFRLSGTHAQLQLAIPTDPTSTFLTPHAPDADSSFSSAGSGSVGHALSHHSSASGSSSSSSGVFEHGFSSLNLNGAVASPASAGHTIRLKLTPSTSSAAASPASHHAHDLSLVGDSRPRIDRVASVPEYPTSPPTNTHAHPYSTPPISRTMTDHGAALHATSPVASAAASGGTTWHSPRMMPHPSPSHTRSQTGPTFVPIQIQRKAGHTGSHSISMASYTTSPPGPQGVAQSPSSPHTANSTSASPHLHPMSPSSAASPRLGSFSLLKGRGGRKICVVVGNQPNTPSSASSANSIASPTEPMSSS